MKFVGINETLDAQSADTVGKRIFNFDVKAEDYFYQFYPVWDRVESEYVISINGRRYHLPSGVFVLIATMAGDTDWVLIDELINMDVEVLQMNNDFNNISLYNPKLVKLDDTVLYMPQTKNPIPISDVTGSRTIIISYKDVYHKAKHLEIQDYCSI